MARRRSADDPLAPELERLYALPPAAFTAARDELAARLRREGGRAAAAAVKALPRPTPSSWAVSRLMRLEPARFQALLAAGRQARQAQGRVIHGGRAPAAGRGSHRSGPAPVQDEQGARPRGRSPEVAPGLQLREALATARTAIEELRRRGLELIAATGRPASAKVADQLAADLQALAFTAGAESAIARGWLDHDLEAPGFEVLAGLQAAAGPAPETAAAAGQARERRAPGAARARETAPGTGPRRLESPPPRSTPEVSRPARGAKPAARRPPAARLGRGGAEDRQRAVEERRRQQQTRREQARTEEARERGRARVAQAEADVEREAEELAQRSAAAAAAERAAADAMRRAADAQREAERARRGAERASLLLERARARLAAARAAADRLVRPEVS